MIRDAGSQDREATALLWADCLRLHHVEPDPGVFARTWDRALAGEGFGLRVAAPSGTLRGFAFHFWQYNSWTGRLDGCLDTLFVAPQARGKGLATALLDDLLALARERGWGSVFWHVAGTNARARALYDRYTPPDGYVRYRVAP